MSTAFTKEPDGAEVFEDLPDRPVTPGPNLVTAHGLALIGAAVEAARTALAEGQASGERALIARAARDLRYWTRRRADAAVQPPPPDDGVVRFGSRVTVRRADGELDSEGMVLGAVQLPPDGQPVVMLADHPTTGGYPVVGVVDPRDLDALAQARPGDAVHLVLGTPVDRSSDA